MLCIEAITEGTRQNCNDTRTFPNLFSFLEGNAQLRIQVLKMKEYDVTTFLFYLPPCSLIVIDVCVNNEKAKVINRFID
jgi:hypothetical protein